MTDLHTHILPCLDDGAQSEEISLEMLKREIEQGVKTVVFTPHYYGRKHSPNEFLEKRDEAYQKIKSDVAGMEISVRLGAEVYVSAQKIASDNALEKLAIEGTKYILMELPLATVWEEAIFERLRDFSQKSEFIPIIAHVERYAEVKKRPQYLTELVNCGCLLQVNTSSFLDENTRKFAFLLLERGFAHCLATDCHDLTNRACDYAWTKALFEAEGRNADFARLQENMRTILNGGVVKPPMPTPIKRFFNKYY